MLDEDARNLAPVPLEEIRAEYARKNGGRGDFVTYKQTKSSPYMPGDVRELLSKFCDFKWRSTCLDVEPNRLAMYLDLPKEIFIKLFRGVKLSGGLSPE